MNIFNPDASASGRLTAKEEIMRLARMVDKITEVD